MPGDVTLELRILGMDCTACARHIRSAIAAVPGVKGVEVLLATEKAVVRLDPKQAHLEAIRQAVQAFGYTVADAPIALDSSVEHGSFDGESPGPADVTRPATRQGVAGRSETGPAGEPSRGPDAFARPALTLLGAVFGAVLFVVVVGEWLGLLEKATRRVPWPVWLAAILAGGFPVFRSVLRAALRRRVTSHTLMTVGALAAIAVGEWATAAVVVFFMRVGDYVERFTRERARRAVKSLVALAPRMARVVRDGTEREVPADQVRAGEIVVVRPGEKIPVDGEVVAGQATLDQAAITGESMPVEVGPGARVFASTLIRLGSLRIRATHVGPDTTFARVIRLVEEAEAHRADIQRLADCFSAYYLPLVLVVAALTLVVSRDPLATAAVLVVACSCSFALATPVAVLASVGAAARKGLLIKGGRYLELLAGADVLLIDKTGTLTLGRPQLTDVVPLNGFSLAEVLALAASAERYSEHPLAEAIREAAQREGVPLAEPQRFEALPGVGVRAEWNGRSVLVGRASPSGPNPGSEPSEPAGAVMELPDEALDAVHRLQCDGKTVMQVACDGSVVGVLGAADRLRPEAVNAIQKLKALGIRHAEILTGDNERVASAVARELGIAYRANLLPEDKVAVVKEYQARGHRVVMIGDGVNDAPALAQADVGIAMGALGTDVAIEVAHVVAMKEDWSLVPRAFEIARRTMRVVRGNLVFTAAYNLVGLTLAAAGLVPPVLAAAAQSLPDLAILGNSSRLLQLGQRHTALASAKFPPLDGTKPPERPRAGEAQ
jgi:Cu+-exporting ATPase